MNRLPLSIIPIKLWPILATVSLLGCRDPHFLNGSWISKINSEADHKVITLNISFHSDEMNYSAFKNAYVEEAIKHKLDELPKNNFLSKYDKGITQSIGTYSIKEGFLTLHFSEESEKYKLSHNQQTLTLKTERSAIIFIRNN